MERHFEFSIGEYYHVYNRGVERKKVFLSNRDYDRMMFLLFTANSNKSVHLSNLNKKNRDAVFNMNRNDTLVDIGCYSLMPNHFHLLIKEKIDGGISRFMKKLLTGYSMFFNKKYERSGPLFLHPFKAEHANSDRYLRYLFSYIHLNPLSVLQPNWKEKIVDESRAKKFLEKYKYSSFIDNMGNNRMEKEILNRGVFPDYFCDKSSFDESITDWINYEDKDFHQG